MAETNDKLLFSGSLNGDDGLRNLPSGDYLDAVNCRVHVTEKSNDGTVENVRGNAVIINPVHPGLNMTIGSFEDKVRKRIIFFNFNATGYNGIYQFFPDRGVNGEIETIFLDDPNNQVLKFGTDFKITGINVVQSLTGDLLYWTENLNRPRKINIDKSNENNKKRKFDLFLKVNFNYTTTIFDENGGIAFTWNTFNPIAGRMTLEEAVAFYLKNIPAGTLAVASFDTCHQFLTATMVNDGKYTMIISSPANTPISYIIANNFYPLPFKEEFIDAIKYPAMCEPLVDPKQDITNKLNLIQNKVFQFRIRLVYDDNEKSVLSPYSRIPSLPIACGANATQSGYNYIELNFNEPRLFDLSSLSIINKVEISVREHIMGKLKYVITLDKWEFLQSNNTYNFYNDGIYSIIDAAIDGKNYDSLPLLSKSQEFGVNRIEYGGITEGYDPICIDAKLNLSYEANINKTLFSFNGKIFINNFFVNQARYANYQPIHDLGAGPVFGGFGNSDVVNQVGTTWGQSIPLAGFVMYLLGTNHRAISRQPNFNYTKSIQDQTTGVMKSNNANINIHTCASGNGTNRKKIRCQIENGQIYSEYSFSGIPAGRYILRMASHLTTQNDLNSSLIWQKTSTYTMSIAGSSGQGARTEALIEIVDNGNGTATINVRDSKSDAIIYTAVGNQLADTHVADLTDPRLGSVRSIVIAGYVTDADISPTPGTDAGLLEDTRMELARVGVTYHTTQQIQNTFAYPAWGPYVAEFKNQSVYTDHNGFFWWVSIYNALNGKIDASVVRSLGIISTPLELGGFNNNNTVGLHSGIFRASAQGLYDNARTKLIGNVSFSGSPISSINIMTTRGNVDVTDAAGDFDMYIYGDTLAYTFSPNVTREDQVLFGNTDTCVIIFSPPSVKYAVPIGDPTVNPMYHNASHPFTVTGINIISLAGQNAIVGLKRGGKYSYGIVYFDNAIRDNNVNTSELLRLKIPFYTEGNPIVAQGRPLVEMEINNLPTDWATHYQIVRTLNGNQGKYLQWTAKTVTYVDDDGNVTSLAQATQIKIDLDNITTFNSQHVDSKVSYTFEDGDRLILIKDSSGNFYNSYIDFKIKGSKTGASLILYVDNLVSAGNITPGTLFEIYNPKKNFDLELYYEIGECYEIGDAGLATAYHKGLSQNQIVVNGASTQPAKVQLTTGDTWYRYRTINYSSTNVIGSAADKPVTWFIEDASISDFYDSKDQSIGRFHVYDKDLGRRYRPTAIRFSNVLIDETKVNGLNSFEGLNEKVLPLEYGLIQRLIMSKDVLCAIHNNSQFVTMYLGKDVLLDNSLQSLVAVSNQVIQKSYQYQGGLGTQHPSSVAIDEDNVVYGYDNSKGIAWKKEINGLVPISEIKMRTFFRNKSQQINSNGGTFIYGVYDNRFRQYIISFEGLLSVSTYLITPETIAFNKDKKAWESRYDFHPEYFGGAINNVLVSFKDGDLWRHGSDVYCNFYGVQYKQSVKVVSNNTPSDMKVFAYTSTESSDVWNTQQDGISTLENQKSELAKEDFELIENVWRASFLRDANTPNSSYPISLIDGDNLRSSIITMELENDQTNYSTIYAINVYGILSQSTNK